MPWRRSRWGSREPATRDNALEQKHLELVRELIVEDGLESAEVTLPRVEKLDRRVGPGITLTQGAGVDPEPELPTIGVILPDGCSLRLRPIRPNDKKRLEDLFYRLSHHSRYHRFQYAKSYISQKELAYLTEVRPPERCAYVATIGEGEQEKIIAVGRWDGLPDGKSAEAAFVVEDDYQLRGIGTVLLEHMAAWALWFNYERLVGQVLAENTVMQHLLEHSGFRWSKRLEAGTYYYIIDLAQREEHRVRHAYRELVAR